MEGLRNWDVWKRMEQAPTRIDELEKRVAALEQRPHLPICQKCGIGYRRLDRVDAPSGNFATFAGAGLEIRVFKCDHCGLETKEKPNTR